VREQVCSSLDVVVHLERDASGLRQIRDIIELAPPTSAGSPAAHRTLVADGVVVNDLQRGRR
jgi:Flp pilus assembly CpaF family ATPase